MSFPVTLNGRTYTLADFQGLNYVDGFPDALEDFVTEAATTISDAEAAAEAKVSEAEAFANDAQGFANDAQTFRDAAAAIANAVAWDAGTTFNTNDAAIGSDGNTYRSLVDNNTGNDPVTDDGSNWLQLTSAGRDFILTPTNTAPADGTTGTTLTPQLEASPYRSLYGVPMASAQWQISEVQDFATTVVDETVAGTSTTFTPSSNLDTLTTYYWRVRYTDDDGNVSDFSDATEFTTANIFTDQPTVTSPTDGETDIGETPTINSSAFNTVNGSDTHVASQWVITRVSDSVEVFDSGEDTTNLTSIDVPAGVLDEGQESYTVKVRHKGQTFGFSAYSPEVTFTTATLFFDPTDPGNIGQPYAGGYLVGIIDTIAGTIDSQDDYQTGLRYALVVSPKDYEGGRDSSPISGLPTGDLRWDSQDRAGQSGSFTRWDGLSSTDSILAKNDASYEAFEFIRSLRQNYPAPAIAGGSDWYLPAMDELELIYRSLKPVEADNIISTQTENFPGSQDNGFNPSSDPQGSAYAANDPAQTTLTDFQNGGAEAVDLQYYWTSTDTDDSGGQAWYQGFTGSGSEGFQNGGRKDFTLNSVRPVRRVVL